MVDDTFIPTEIRMMEASYSYLAGIGYEAPIALNLISYSLELQKINMQARMLARSEEIAGNELVEKVAQRVVFYLTDGNE